MKNTLNHLKYLCLRPQPPSAALLPFIHNHNDRIIPTAALNSGKQFRVISGGSLLHVKNRVLWTDEDYFQILAFCLGITDMLTMLFLRRHTREYFLGRCLWGKEHSLGVILDQTLVEPIDPHIFVRRYISKAKSAECIKIIREYDDDAQRR